MPTSAAPEPKRNDPHLARLEAESIHILREAVAETHNPVMLFSAGKDSTVLAHLALRAFAPCAPRFPLLHVDSTWEFRSLIEFRDAFSRRHGFKLIVCRNEEGRAAGINPFDQGDRYSRHAHRTAEARLGCRRLRRGLRRGATRRGAVAHQGTDRVGPQCRTFLGSAPTTPGTLAAVQPVACERAIGARVSALQLVAAVVEETLRAPQSERQGRFGDGEDGGSLEQKKREGYS